MGGGGGGLDINVSRVQSFYKKIFHGGVSSKAKGGILKGGFFNATIS